MRSRADARHLLAAMLLVPLGCGQKPPGAAILGESASTAPPSVSVRVLDAGEGLPHVILRFEPRVGAGSRVRLTARDTSHENGRDFAQAGVFTLEGHVTEVTPDNDVRYVLKVIHAEDRDGGALPPSSGALTLLSEEVTISAQGVARERNLKGYSMGWGMDLFKKSLMQIEIELAPIFPSQPISVGARWEVERTIWKGTYDGTSKAIYTLMKHEGSRVRLRIESTQRADRQAMHLLQPAADEHAELLSMTGKGSASVEFALDGCPVAQGDTSVSLEAEMIFTTSGKTERFHRTERIDTEIVAGDR